jgi:hypothetical protein
MDAKTVLLLGIGMVVLLLLGYCVAPSRSATMLPRRQLRNELSRGLSLRMDLARRQMTNAAHFSKYRELHSHAPAIGRLATAEHNVRLMRSF